MSVIIVCGAPASGKSTITKQIAENSKYVILNRDAEGGTIAQLLPKLENHIKNNNNVILDNLFPTVESRKPFIEMCKKYNVDISCKLMSTSIEEAQFNAVARAIKLIGKFPTPEAIKEAKHTNIFPPLVLFKYKKDFQKPTIEEGFSKVEIIPFVRKEDPTFTGKALILDYDGTIRECINGNNKYPLSEDQIEIKPSHKAIIDTYKKNGYFLLGVSNQSGVAKGELTYDRATQLFEHTNKLLGVDIEFRFCPHQSAPISCYCRKPMPGIGVEFIMKYLLNRKECYFVGDLKTDETFSTRCGFNFIHANEFFK